MYFAITVLLGGTFFLFTEMHIALVAVLGFVEPLVGLFWFYLITKRSGFFRTIYGRLMFISGAIIMAGALAKLEHWWWASYFLIAGFLSFGIIYFIRFILKKKKNLLDVVKLLFLESSWVLALAKLEHWPVEIYDLVRLGLFYVMIYLFAIEKPPIHYKDEKFSFDSK